MHRFKVFSVLVLLVLLLGTTIAMGPMPLAQKEDGWLCYVDQDYGFTLEYPAEGWTTETTLEQDSSFSVPSAIIKRQTFFGPGGVVDVDVWLSHGHDLSAWLKDYATTRVLEGVPFDAQVAGQIAVIFFKEGITSDMLATFFGDGQYIYRLWYTITRDEQALNAYWHMLSSFSLSGGHTGVTVIPGEVQQRAQRAAWDSGMILEPSCCGYYQSGNPFSCCSNKGNCTWWAYYKMGGVPFRGDAGTWWDQVPNYYPTWLRQTGAPPTGKRSMAAYITGHPVYPNGHVSYINMYWGGPTVTVSYMGWCVNCGTTKTISVSEPTGYIFRKYEPGSVSPETR